MSWRGLRHLFEFDAVYFQSVKTSITTFVIFKAKLDIPSKRFVNEYKRRVSEFKVFAQANEASIFDSYLNTAICIFFDFNLNVLAIVLKAELGLHHITDTVSTINLILALDHWECLI